MKVYVVMGNDRPECVLAEKEAADEYVAYKKSLEPGRQKYGRQLSIHWRYYEFDLVYGQHR